VSEVVVIVDGGDGGGGGCQKRRRWTGRGIAHYEQRVSGSGSGGGSGGGGHRKGRRQNAKMCRDRVNLGHGRAKLGRVGGRGRTG